MALRWDTGRCERTFGTVDELAANICSHWHRASPEQRAEGEHWYPLAHLLAHDVHPVLGSAVAAALSPRFDWALEVGVLLDLVADPEAFVPDDCGALLRNVEKANDILSGDYDPDQVLGGYKVRAFWKLLSDPFDPYEVCVDTWSIRVALDQHVGDGETKPIFATKVVYDHFQSAYRKAAAELGVLPSVAQAVTWTVRRADTWRGRRDAS